MCFYNKDIIASQDFFMAQGEAELRGDPRSSLDDTLGEVVPA
jgi:hypothetical protein